LIAAGFAPRTAGREATPLRGSLAAEHLSGRGDGSAFANV